MTSPFRYEIKFCCTLRDIDAIYTWIYQSPNFIKKHFPSRHINNIYFDTYDWNDASDNLIGLNNREKLRLRWYGEVNETTAMRLERKIRRDRLGTKQFYDVGTLSLSGLSKSELAAVTHDSMKKTDHREPDLRLRNPVIRNRYLREYYIDSSEKIRITIDKEQSFYSVDNSANVLQANRIDYPIFVIEVKYANTDGPLARSVLDGFPLKPVRHSKYLAGLARVIEQPYF